MNAFEVGDRVVVTDLYPANIHAAPHPVDVATRGMSGVVTECRDRGYGRYPYAVRIDGRGYDDFFYPEELKSEDL